MTVANIEKHVPAEDIAAWLDDEEALIERRVIEQHMRTCAACATEASNQRQIRMLLAQMGAAELPRSFVLSDHLMKTTSLTESSKSARFTLLETVLRYVSIAAVLAMLVLGSLQLLWPSITTNTNTSNTETTTFPQALQTQESTGEGALQATDNSDEALGFGQISDLSELTTPVEAPQPFAIAIGIAGLIAVVASASWILIRNRDGTPAHE